MDYPIQANNLKKRTCYLVDFAVPVNHGVKEKRVQIMEKYLDLAREQKRLLDIKMTVRLVFRTSPPETEKKKETAWTED